MRVYLDAVSKSPTVSIGTQALIIASMEIIAKHCNDVEFLVLSAFPEVEQHYLSKERFSAKVIKRKNTPWGVISDVISIAGRSDLIISAWGDGYITTPPHKIFQKTFFLKLSGKPVILFPSSIGPFKGNFKMFLSRLGLLQFDRLISRDTVTYEYMKKIGIKDVLLCPDTAFILEPVGPDRVGEILSTEGVPYEAKCVGLNVSQLLNCLFDSKLSLNYAQFMSELIRYLHQKTDCHVLLIPHQVYPSCLGQQQRHAAFHGDDRYAIEQIMKILKDKSYVTPILGEYGCREYKGIIGMCEIFVGGRMHSVIAAVSQNVPSVIMQYSHKARGVMEMVGIAEYVWDIQRAPRELHEKIDHIWEEKQAIKVTLKGRMDHIKQETWGIGKALEVFLQ